MVTLDAKVDRSFIGGQQVLTVSLHNPSKSIALMTHLQLRNKLTGERILPVYPSDNYVSLVPDETRVITIAAGIANSSDAEVVVDGWNVTVTPATSKGVSIAPNVDAQPSHWPTTGLPFQTVGLR
jgi:hypothetical protein